ncbi:helix-turn-helix domain-containing protein [Cellulomonas dongxiuzhuiae]|uniref:helix-turn-helix domain-containing protein n=1 Tax=Cellulomonas dongxiuzhuiae TaxID=2819979 RepID=UPI001AAEEE6D|nr:helix-turn-helix transcriptional regulator [Cellulomonas dongxiuzhuiae]MBO3088631.1 helix-turn-helix transcriptional regulator [Cellulomonas dongxiuzhuiae]
MSEPAIPAPSTDHAGLARALTALRERHGLSVRDIARLSGLPLGTVRGHLSGRHLPQPGTTAQFERMLDALGLTPDERTPSVDAVARLRRVPGPRPATAAVPYRGLARYEIEDAHLFVGREAAVDDLVRGSRTGRRRRSWSSGRPGPASPHCCAPVWSPPCGPRAPRSS